MSTKHTPGRWNVLYRNLADIVERANQVVANDGTIVCTFNTGGTALAWYAAGRWVDGATGKEWAHRERITMWHEIAARPRQEDQARAMQALAADTAEKETT